MFVCLVLCKNPQEVLAEMMENAGFSHVNYNNIIDGVVSVHSGFKLWIGIVSCLEVK